MHEVGEQWQEMFKRRAGRSLAFNMLNIVVPAYPYQEIGQSQRVFQHGQQAGILKGHSTDSSASPEGRHQTAKSQ